MKEIKDRIAGIIMTVLSLALTVGVKSFFSACGPKDDGTWMTCHWAEQAVFGMGIVLTVISAVVLAAGRKPAALGASLAAVPAACVAMLAPGVLINLCMMTNMHCHTVMRPAVMVISAVIAVIALVNSVLMIKSGRRNGEGR